MMRGISIGSVSLATSSYYKSPADFALSEDFRSRPNSVGEGEQETLAKSTNYLHIVRQLDLHYGIVKRKILKYQSPTTGLFPRVANDQIHAYIRDSIYCAAGVWSLYQAYKRIDDDRGKSHELGQSVVKCMRGILFCWLRQASRVQDFKKNQTPKNALHSIFHLVTGEPVFDCENYGHLQLDIPSLYLIYLVQMITSGLQIIYTMDEVNFIQNLVYYVERAYRTSDFGMWERGNKYNNGTPEVHASSIGMAKAALEAVNGCNLFGEKGTAWSVIYVDIDAHNRNRSIFETLLPRESSSKNTDSALLATISYPTFATHDEALYERTKEKLIRKLKGEYGFKRFLRDGYKTAVEDPERRFYNSGESKNFDTIENEWPLMYIYMIIDGMYKNKPDQVKEYQKLLHNRVFKDYQEDVLIPMYYSVPEDCIELERINPHSNHRIPSEAGSQPNKVFLWGQSLYLISQLLVENLLHINELDPIRRYLPSYSRPRRTGRYSAFQGSAIGTATDLVVQVVLIAESARLQAMMATYGIQTQTPHEVEPIQIWPQQELVKVYEHLGVNEKLGLEGRPPRPIGSLGTSKLYRLLGNTILCYPIMFGISDFYFSHDMSLLIDDIKNELHFIARYWRLSGRPTVCLLIREEHMRDEKFRELIDLLAMMKSGYCDKLQVRIGRLQNLISSSCVEHLDFLHNTNIEFKFSPFQQVQHKSVGYQSLTDIPKFLALQEPIQNFKPFNEKKTEDIVNALRREETLYGQSQLLGILVKRQGLKFEIDQVTLEDYLHALSGNAGARRYWQVVRYCSSVLQQLVDSISPYLTSILVHGKQVTFGVIGHEEVLIDRPLNPSEIHSLVYNTIQPYDMYHAVLQQEIVQYIGKLISTVKHLFTGILKIRIGWIINAMTLYVKHFHPETEPLECLSPSAIRRLLTEVLNVNEWTNNPRCTPLHRRQIEGALGLVPCDFYDRVWVILAKASGGIVVAGYHLPQEPTIYDMTLQDLNFALMVENMLSRIPQPEQRQIVVELMIVLSTMIRRNPELMVEEKIDTDKLVEKAIKLFTTDKGKDGKGLTFYSAPPSSTTRYLARAVVNFVLKETSAAPGFCNVS
uniref:Phosphorylase b kinase regulatory subunit n=1 Tax=Scolopendra viridis TaxID=118503 RepID=A0A4D5RAB5_SCOVI